MNKFRNRLTVIFISFIGLSNVVAGLLAVSVVRDSQIHSLQAGLTEQLQMYLAIVDWEYVAEGSVHGQMFRAEAVNIARKIDANVTFFDADGRVLGDSGEVEGLADASATSAMSAKASGGAKANGSGSAALPEIGKAAANRPGVDIRWNDREGARMMYVAAPAAFGRAGVGFIRFGKTMSHVDAETAQIAAYLGAGLLVVLTVTAGIAYRISQNLTGPLEKITKVAYQITNMNYRARVSIPNRDEIGQLGQAINKMSDSLQYQLNQIKQDERRLKSVLENMTSGVVMIDREERIVLMNRAAEELLGVAAQEALGQPHTKAAAQFELVKMIRECLERQEHIRDEIVFYYPEERTMDIHLAPITGAEDEWVGIMVVMHDISAIRRLERMRSEFVANVSHELKTPIAAVKGFAETLLGGAVNDAATAKTFLQIIYDESERLNRLIGDTLDLSRIESKRVPLHFSPIELSSFVSRIFHMMASEAKKKRISLVSSIDAGLYIEADEDRLRQILINLLSNGITYSHDEAKVTVTVEPVFSTPDESDEYDKVRITVEDNGVGIPKKDLPRIFERFYRVDKARTRVSGGTGLGLSIVKHLVELHKGTIRVESTVGMGSRFIVELPVLH